MKLIIAVLAAYPFSALAVPQLPALPIPSGDEVTVDIPDGTIIGAVTGVESFHGIPFADPPVDDLRLRPPQKLSRALGEFNATGFAPGCPQMPPNTTEIRLPNLRGKVMTPPHWPEDRIMGQEDCLTVTVQRPRGTQADARLPVLFFIFGGGFMFGATNANNAEKLMQFAEKQGQPFIFVGVNYRVGGFGFLGGAEVLEDGSANLGLRDQRMGLEWVADNIAYFGGDPDRVTLWGQSAGSISVFDQMALYRGNASYNGSSLFRGAIMNSGSVLPTERVDARRAEAVFGAVAEAAGCASPASMSRLACLRNVSFPTFYHAANSVPRILDNSSLALSYLPRPDGTLLAASPDAIAASGEYHAVPAILTSQEDEGTLFSFAQRHLTDTDRLVDYLSETFFDEAAREQVTGLVATYPIDSAAGSPFRTAQRNEWYLHTYKTGRGFKRVAAILGDFVFTLARRLALEGMAAAHPQVPLWSSLSTLTHGLAPYWGTPHGTDVALLFDGGVGIASDSTRTYYLNFLYNQDPNNASKPYRN